MSAEFQCEESLSSHDFPGSGIIGWMAGPGRCAGVGAKCERGALTGSEGPGRVWPFAGGPHLPAVGNCGVPKPPCRRGEIQPTGYLPPPTWLRKYMYLRNLRSLPTCANLRPREQATPTRTLFVLAAKTPAACNNLLLAVSLLLIAYC